jgi:hypothetical protein
VFWLTSAVNALALALGAGLLLTRIGGGPHDLARALLPLIIATPLTLLIAVSPKLGGHRPQQGTGLRWWSALIDGVPQLIVLPAVNPERIQPTDFDHAGRLIRQALTAARAVLDAAPVPESVAA